MLMQVSVLKAQSPTKVNVAEWLVEGMGLTEHNICKPDILSVINLYVENGQAHLCINGTNKNSTFTLMAGEIENLYLDQNSAYNDDYIGMKSKVDVIYNSQYHKTGTLYISIAKKDDIPDVLQFNFSDEQIFFTCNLLSESYLGRVLALAFIGSNLKNGVKLDKTLEESLLEMANETN